MFQDTETVYITLHISSEDHKRIAVENVPIDVTCGQFLQKIAPIIYENERKNKNQNQNSDETSDFNYCLKVNDKILAETDTLDSNEVDVIQRPEEVTNLANIFLFLSFIAMIAVPLTLAFYYHFLELAYHSFIFSAFIFSFFVAIFPEKKDYKSFGLKIKPKKNTLFEALVLLVKSFHPNFRLEDVLLEQ